MFVCEICVICGIKLQVNILDELIGYENITLKSARIRSFRLIRVPII